MIERRVCSLRFVSPGGFSPKVFGPLRQFNLAHPLVVGLRSGFGSDLYTYEQSPELWECGNRAGFAGFPRAVGRVGSLILAFQAFHGPAFPQLFGLLGRFSSFLLSVHRSAEAIRLRAGLQNVRTVSNAIQQRLA